MNARMEQIEQCAQLCYGAQRELQLTRGLASVGVEIRPPWVIAPDSDKQAAREQVCLLWEKGAAESGESFEDKLCVAIVNVYRWHVTGHVFNRRAAEPQGKVVLA